MTKESSQTTPAFSGVKADDAGRSTTTWQAVRNEVLSRIRSNQWPAGELIPTEKQLAAELGCARATVNRALRELADNGVLERRRKVGTRVAATPSRAAARETSVLRNEIIALGAEYGYQLTSFGRASAPQAVARHLQIARNEDLIMAVSLHLADSRPYCCETIWLNQSVLPPIIRTELAEGSPQEWLERKVAMTHEQIGILAEGIGPICAGSMGLQLGTPVLTIERTGWTDKTPVAHSRQVYNPGHRLVTSA